MRVAIIIPARLHSTRLPGKLLLPAAGLPLICHTLLAAENLRCLAPEIFTPPIVATDAPEIAQVVRDFSRERHLSSQAVLTRSNHLSGSDRIAEAAEALPPEIDHVLNLQGDEPEIDPASLLPLLECLAKGKADLATLAYPLPASEATDPNLVKVVVDRALRALYFSRANLPYRRSTNLNPPAYGHVGVYLYRRPALERF
ncbi:MAG: 3-deoxy-manno-octulosonate cytidylyltransferase, partial [Planctomycetota bacterium]|nr:3-deoxy-manno-octulosonate cytidylyltransferase [Planctomycetota bacterium]